MDDPLFRDRLTHRALFLGFAVLVLILRMLPIGTLPVRVPGPDLVLCVTLAWVLRRPDYVPAVLIAAIFLMEDMLLQRPPGLWAVVVLLGSEFLRSREPLSRELPFPVEWAMVSIVMLMMLLGNRMVLAAVLTPQPAFGPSFLQALLTVMVYPVVVVVSQLALGVTKSATGEVDTLGRRL